MVPPPPISETEESGVSLHCYTHLIFGKHAPNILSSFLRWNPKQKVLGKLDSCMQMIETRPLSLSLYRISSKWAKETFM